MSEVDPACGITEIVKWHLCGPESQFIEMMIVRATAALP
jgi:hypothetical protein